MASARQPQWNIHEAVVLLDAYLEVKENKISRKAAVKKVSAGLRQMAEPRKPGFVQARKI